MSEIHTGSELSAHFASATDKSALPPRLIMLGTSAVMSLVNYAYAMVAGRLLAPADFGLLAFAQSLLLVSTTVLQTGLPWSLTRSIVSSGPSQRSRLVSGSAFANVILGVAMAMAILVLFQAGPLRLGLERHAVVVIVVASLPVMAVLAVARATALGIEDIGAYAALQTIEVVTKAVLGVTLIVAGARATGAVSGFLLGAVAATLFGVVHLIGRRGIHISRDMELPSPGETGPMFGALLGSSLLLSMDLLAVKLLSADGRVATGYYQAATVLASAPYFLVSTGLVTILFAQLAGLSSMPDTRMAVGTTLAAACVIFIPMNVALICLPGPALVLLFGASYEPAQAILRLLALGTSAATAVAILGAAFQAVGLASTAARIQLTITALEAIALVLVVPSWGAEGAAAVFVTATFTSAFILGWTYMRRVGKGAISRVYRWGIRYTATVVIALVSGGTVLFFTHTALIAVAIGIASYFGAALLLHTLLGPVSLILSRLSPAGDHALAEGGDRYADTSSRL